MIPNNFFYYQFVNQFYLLKNSSPEKTHSDKDVILIFANNAERHQLPYF